MNTNFYYSVYSNGQLVQAARGNPDWHLPGNVAKTLSTDVVRFGGFVGKLGAIKIHSPGSLLVNLGMAIVWWGNLLILNRNLV